jgi:glucosamine--fructose-6-phosphate aminotransferase (isomerizing)
MFKNTQDQGQAECCGIVGYIGNRPQGGPVCINGLKILEARGYDSCGLVSIAYNNNTPFFKRTRFASTDRFGGDCIRKMQMEGADKHNDNIAIGHTRWATHGDKNENNSHPHFDHKERVAIVHNGIIENYHELKQELKEKHNLLPKTETDTEVVAMFIGVYLDEGKSLFDSI